MEKVRAAATIPWDEAVDFTAEAFSSTGVPAADARKAAEALVDADLHGTVTHGLKNLRNYVSGLLNGTINPPAWALPSRVVEPGSELSAPDAESLFLDMALSVVGGNRLDIFRRRNEPI